MERRRTLAPRDQETSAFSTILMRLVDGSGAIAAMLVDSDGETVDYAGAGDVHEMKVAAADWRLLLQIVSRSGIPHWKDSSEVYFRGSRKSFALIALSEGYSLVLELASRAFGVSARAVAEAVVELEAEAGLTYADERRERERWVRVDVRTNARRPRRPEAVWVEGGWAPLEILGHYRVGRSDVGFRARLPTGAELTLVREPLGRWYADVLPGL